MNKTLFAFAIAAVTSLAAAPAHAGLCVSPPYTGSWVISGTPPYYPQVQVSYQMNDLAIDTVCVDDPTQVCNGDVCSITDGVKLLPTLNVATTDFTFSGPTTHFWGVNTMTEGSDGWYYEDTSIEGNPTRVWIQPSTNNTLPVVFDVTYLGQHYVQWVTFVRPIKFVPIHFGSGGK